MIERLTIITRYQDGLFLTFSDIFLNVYTLQILRHTFYGLIAELTGYARRTVIKALSLLKQLEMVLSRHVMRSKSGGNGANLYVLQKYRKMEECTPSSAPREDRENLDGTSSEGSKMEAETKIIKSLVNKDLIRICSPYDRFKSIIYSFVKDKQLLYRLYGVYLGQTKYLKEAYKEQDLLDVSVYALRTTFNKMKVKKLNNPAGYFNNTLSNSLDKLYYDSIEDMYVS